MLKNLLTTFSLIVLFTACFGGLYKGGSVIGYSKQVVKTKGGAFRIGPLPDYWRPQKIKYRALLFVNSKDRSSITVDSWCKGSFDDASLSELSNQLLRGIKDFKISDRHRLELDQRGALKTDGVGSLDGRDVFLSVYVLKMNQCVFDFVYVSLPEELDYYSDFKSMVHGFKYLKGPDLL